MFKELAYVLTLEILQVSGCSGRFKENYSVFGHACISQMCLSMNP